MTLLWRFLVLGAAAFPPGFVVENGADPTDATSRALDLAVAVHTPGPWVDKAKLADEEYIARCEAALGPAPKRTEQPDKKARIWTMLGGRRVVANKNLKPVYDHENGPPVTESADDKNH